MLLIARIAVLLYL
ncbi:hypothetical protein ECEC1865_6125, partial [Escherichia coli EC1865]